MTTKYGIIETDRIYHAGDQRSIDHPGHGYPAHTETVTKLREISTKEAWEDNIRSAAKRGQTIRAITFQEVEIVTETTIHVTQ